MKIDINKQYKTSDGRDVKIYTTEHGGAYPVVGGVGEYVFEWLAGGCHPHSDALNLIEVKPEQVVWVVVDEGGCVDGYRYEKNARNLTNGGTLYRVTLTDDMVVTQ